MPSNNGRAGKGRTAFGAARDQARRGGDCAQLRVIRPKARRDATRRAKARRDARARGARREAGTRPAGRGAGRDAARRRRAEALLWCRMEQAVRARVARTGGAKRRVVTKCWEGREVARGLASEPR